MKVSYVRIPALQENPVPEEILRKTPISSGSSKCHKRDRAWCPGVLGVGIQHDAHSGKEGFPADSIPPWATLEMWGPWSQFPELPFSNYVTALPVGTLVPGGTGAGVRSSRCVSHKPRRRLNSSDTEIKVVLYWKKETQTVRVSVAHPRLSTGASGH